MRRVNITALVEAFCAASAVAALAPHFENTPNRGRVWVVRDEPKALMPGRD